MRGIEVNWVADFEHVELWSVIIWTRFLTSSHCPVPGEKMGFMEIVTYLRGHCFWNWVKVEACVEHLGVNQTLVHRHLNIKVDKDTFPLEGHDHNVEGLVQ